MARTAIKTLFYLFIAISLFSCRGLNSNSKMKSSGLKLIKTEKLNKYKLLTYATESDTILIVAGKDVKKKCIEENFMYISIQGFNKIDKLNDIGEEISFSYRIKSDDNKNLTILTGSAIPGKSIRKVFSYNSFPYYIEKCTYYFHKKNN